MGAAASNTPKTGNEHVDKTVRTMAVIGALKSSADDSKVVKPSKTTHRKEDIYNFVKQQKQSQEEAYQEMKQEDKDRRISLLPEVNPPLKKQNEDIYHVESLEEDKVVTNCCGVCRKSVRVTIDGYPCRVCGTTYHRACLSKSGRFTSDDIKMFDRGNSSSIGWSCDYCDNICNLLRPPEVDELATAFEKFDTNNDQSVSVDEYMAFKKDSWRKTERKPMPEYEENFQKLQFNILDADNNGEVNYWEFVKHEACKKLARRSPEELVGLLTQVEKVAARRMYNLMDEDGDGVVQESEARRAYRTFYGNLDRAIKTSASKKSMPHLNKPRVGTKSSQFTDQAMKMFLDADVDLDRSVTWKEFLNSQALYILSSRPNRTNISI